MRRTIPAPGGEPVLPPAETSLPGAMAMKKIALNLETLSVESFDVGNGMELDRGTVQANEGAALLATPGRSCYRTACCPETTLC